VDAWDLLRDCTRALSWLYSHHNASHLNIKPGNILKCQRKFKFADPFLDSSVLQACLKEEGMHWDGWAYLAPEIKRFSTLIEGLDMRQSDIYSLGMCLLENIVG
jgi:serine/threonine protein kinase